LSDILLQNYKDSTSVGGSSIGSTSLLSGINNQHAGFNNNLREKLNQDGSFTMPNSNKK